MMHLSSNVTDHPDNRQSSATLSGHVSISLVPILKISAVAAAGRAAQAEIMLLFIISQKHVMHVRLLAYVAAGLAEWCWSERADSAHTAKNSFKNLIKYTDVMLTHNSITGLCSRRYYAMMRWC